MTLTIHIKKQLMLAIQSHTTALRIASLTYLLIPNFIFLATWLKPTLGLFFGIILLYVFWGESIREEIQIAIPTQQSAKVNPKTLIILALIALGLCLCFGVGEYRSQVIDWGANNFKVYDLVTHKWPVYYENVKAYCCYYWGYYLTTAVLGKVMGLAYCKYLILIWSWIGVFLILLWLLSLKNSLLVVVLFLLFNNANMVLLPIDLLDIPFFETCIKYVNVHLNGFNINFWSPMITSFQWVPQHLIPAGITTLFLMQPSEQKSYKSDALIFMSTVLWSPLISIGLVPIVLAKLWATRQQVKLFQDFWKYVLIGIPFIPVALYLTANNTINNTTNVNQFIWNSSPYWLRGYLIFIMSNLLIWYGLLKPQLKAQNPFLIISLVSIALLALYRMGICNDLLFRGAIPASFALGVAIVTQLDKLRGENNKSKKYILWLSFFLYCSIPSVYRIYQGILPSQPTTTIESPFMPNSTNIMDFLDTQYEPNASEQYTLKKHSIFEEYLMKTNR